MAQAMRRPIPCPTPTDFRQVFIGFGMLPSMRNGNDAETKLRLPNGFVSGAGRRRFDGLCLADSTGPVFKRY